MNFPFPLHYTLPFDDSKSSINILRCTFVPNLDDLLDAIVASNLLDSRRLLFEERVSGVILFGGGSHDSVCIFWEIRSRSAMRAFSRLTCTVRYTDDEVHRRLDQRSWKTYPDIKVNASDMRVRLFPAEVGSFVPPKVGR